MSMLSSQVDELHDRADELRKLMEHSADWTPAEAVTLVSAVDAMREAADAIESLRDRLQAAELGSGTCEYCKGGTFDGQTGMMSNHGWQNIIYCPNCGTKVKRVGR